MQLQATHLRGQYRLLHFRADTRPGKAQTAVEETSSRAAQAAIELRDTCPEAAHAVVKQTRQEAAQAAIERHKKAAKAA